MALLRAWGTGGLGGTALDSAAGCGRELRGASGRVITASIIFMAHPSEHGSE